jgi:hypothetical protein
MVAGLGYVAGSRFSGKGKKIPPLEIISGVETWSMAHGEG